MFAFSHPPQQAGGYMYAASDAPSLNAAAAPPAAAAAPGHPYEYRPPPSLYDLLPAPASEGSRGAIWPAGQGMPSALYDARATLGSLRSSAGAYNPGVSPVLVPPLPASVEQSIATGNAPWANYNRAGLHRAGGDAGEAQSPLGPTTDRHNWHHGHPFLFDPISNTPGGQQAGNGQRDQASHPFAFAYPNPPTRGLAPNEPEGRASKRARANGHGTFEQDLLLLQTCLSDLVALLQPFAASPGQPQPQSPAPFLHTRFLRLTQNINNTLRSLGPASHTLLAPEFTAPPPFPDAADKMTTAEKEMQVIRKRRDALIAKAAQSKAAAATQPSSSLPSGPFSHPLSAQTDYLSVSGGNVGYPAKEGRCHGCGVGVSQEWRAGPDGPQTLCDTCGTHYEKLTRRRSVSSLDRPLSGESDLR